MDMLILIVSTLLKIGFVLAIIFSFAPIFIWAERRQSAMIQDRVGPTRADIPVPQSFVPAIRGALGAGSGMHLLLAAVSGLVALWLAIEAGFVAHETGEFLLEGGIGGTELDPLLSWNGVLWLAVLFVPLNLGLSRALSYGSRVFDGHITLFGLVHPIADAMKFMWKEDFVPENGDKLLHAIAPMLTVLTAIATFTVIPFADILYLDALGDVIPASGAIAGDFIPMQVATVNVGILFIFAVAGTGVVGAAIAGYASDNKYALLGGLRAAGQMVSYEVTLGLTIVPMFMVYNSLLLEDMVHWQMGNWWGIFINPLAFVLFLTASLAEAKRIPFDLPEAESELVAGYFTEYSGMKFGMFFMGEFIEVIVLSALATTIFFGGYDVPFLTRSGFEFMGYIAEVPHWGVIAIQMLSFVVKIALFIWFQLMVRWTLPRFRYDQIMNLCWKVLLPVSLLSIMVTGIGILIMGG